MHEVLVCHIKKQAVFFNVIFVGSFEKTLIAPVASGVASCDVVITQSREHIYVSPVCSQSSGTRTGVWRSIVRWVPWCTGLLSTAWGVTSVSHGAHHIHSHFAQWFSFSSMPSLEREWMAWCHGANSMMSQLSHVKNYQLWLFSHLSFNSRIVLLSVSWNRQIFWFFFWALSYHQKTNTGRLHKSL